MITQLSGKTIYGVISKADIPSNLNDYRCNLISQQYQLNNKKFVKNFIEFKSNNEKAKPFSIILSKFKVPTNLKRIFNMKANQFELNQKVNRICDMEVIKEVKKSQKQQLHIDIDSDRSQPAQINFQPQSQKQSNSRPQNFNSQLNHSQMRHIVIQLLRNSFQPITTIKQLKKRIEKQIKTKISQKMLKIVVDEVCDYNPQKKSTRGFVLRAEYLGNEDLSDSMQGPGRKRSKNN